MINYNAFSENKITHEEFNKDLRELTRNSIYFKFKCSSLNQDWFSFGGGRFSLVFTYNRWNVIVSIMYQGKQRREFKYVGNERYNEFLCKLQWFLLGIHHGSEILDLEQCKFDAYYNSL